MAGVSNRLSAGVFVVLLLFSTTSSLLLPQQEADEVSTFNSEWVRFDVREDTYRKHKACWMNPLSPSSATRWRERRSACSTPLAV